MNLEVILSDHCDLCENIYQLMLEENRWLKSNNTPPNDEFLGRKRQLLEQLESSLDQIRMRASEQTPRSPELRELFEKAPRIVMKALLLDRENEQLLLKCALQARTPVPNPKPTAEHIQRIYGKYQAANRTVNPDISAA